MKPLTVNSNGLSNIHTTTSSPQQSAGLRRLSLWAFFLFFCRYLPPACSTQQHILALYSREAGWRPAGGALRLETPRLALLLSAHSIESTTSTTYAVFLLHRMLLSARRAKQHMRNVMGAGVQAGRRNSRGISRVCRGDYYYWFVLVPAHFDNRRVQRSAIISPRCSQQQMRMLYVIFVDRRQESFVYRTFSPNLCSAPAGIGGERRGDTSAAHRASRSTLAHIHNGPLRRAYSLSPGRLRRLCCPSTYSQLPLLLFLLPRHVEDLTLLSLE